MEPTPGQNEAQSQDELFDVVNEQDEVIGQLTRGEVHKQRLLHRAVHVFVFDAKGRVFLQKRSMAKDTNPGCWSPSASGHVDAGETYDHAAVRELHEEIGVQVDATPERWLRLNACRETGREFVWIYRLEHEGPFTLNPAEIEKGAWFDPVELTRDLITHPKRYTPALRYIWTRLPGFVVQLPATTPPFKTPSSNAAS